MNQPSLHNVSQKNNALISLEWRENKQIAVLKAHNMTRDSVDAWVGMTSQLLQFWPVDKPYLVMHNLSGNILALSPYARSKVKGVNLFNEHVQGRIAVVLPKTLLAQAIRVLLSTHERPKLVIDIFFSAEAGEAWLKKALPCDANV